MVTRIHISVCIYQNSLIHKVDLTYIQLPVSSDTCKVQSVNIYSISSSDLFS